MSLTNKEKEQLAIASQQDVPSLYPTYLLFAKAHGIPPSTLHDWRKKYLNLKPKKTKVSKTKPTKKGSLPQLAYLITEKEITIMLDAQTVKTSKKADTIAALLNEDIDYIQKNFFNNTIQKNLKKVGFIVKNGMLYDTVNKVEFSFELTNLIAKAPTEIIRPLANNLLTGAVPFNALLKFLSNTGYAINNKGEVTAYKVVTSAYMDKHSRTIDNSIGESVYIPRERVDANPDNTCSYGLHICSKQYINSFYSKGDRIVEVSVDVRNFVAIPADYEYSKVRCCGYKVIKDVTAEFT